MHVHVFVTESEWEQKEERDQNKVGGIERMNEREGGKITTKRGMNDGDTHIYSTHTHRLQQR